MKFLAVVICGLCVLSGGLFVGVPIYDQMEKYPVKESELQLPLFSVVEIDHSHVFLKSEGIPYSSGAIIDIDNDGRDEIFLGGGVRQADGLFRYDNGKFVDISDQAGLVKQGDAITTGVVVFDVDDNGYSDLLISRENGLFLYRNEEGTFALEALDLGLKENEIPFTPALEDLNRDGYIDFFLPVADRGRKENWYLLREIQAAATPRLYINNGDDSFTDITDSVGLIYPSGALQAVFADLDEDGLEDLAVLYNDGKMVTWKNRGSLLFEKKHHSLSTVRGDFLGMGVGDYNRDGRIDFLLTSRGSTIPDFLAKLLYKYRSLRYQEWVLMKNTGFFSFRNVAEKTHLSNYELARGALFSDINGDGSVDLAVSQNHPYWPFHLVGRLRLPGRILLQDSEGQYVAASTTESLGNRELGVTPLEGDVNGDGRPDIVHVAIGGKSRVFINTKNKNHYLKVHLSDTVKSFGAKVTVRTLSGKDIVTPFLVGKELCGDSSHAMFIGLGSEKATDVMVDYRDGGKDQISGVLFNRTVEFK